MQFCIHKIFFIRIMLITLFNYTHTVINVFQLPYIFVIFMVFLYRLQCFNYASSFARAEHGSKLFIDYCDNKKRTDNPRT